MWAEKNSSECPAMSAPLRHPAFILAGLGVLSGLLGTYLLGGNYGTAPQLGFYLVLAGVWFGLVVGFAAWRWGKGSLAAALMAVLTTWIAWEAAVNVAIQLDGALLQGVISHAAKSYVAGFIAGGVGAAITWAGAAIHVAPLRIRAAFIGIVAAGAFLGLLLPATNFYDSPAVLLLPWQATIAGLIGLNMAPMHEWLRRSGANEERGKRTQMPLARAVVASIMGFITLLATMMAAHADVLSDESAGTVEELLKGGWQIAGYASNSDNRSTFILFKNPGENYLVQCLVGYDVTRSPRTFENCYRLR
jgi:hypothetical protein